MKEWFKHQTARRQQQTHPFMLEWTVVCGCGMKGMETHWEGKGRLERRQDGKMEGMEGMSFKNDPWTS